MKRLIVVLVASYSAQGICSPVIVDSQARPIGYYSGTGTENVEIGVSLKGYRFGFVRSNGRLAGAEGIGGNKKVFFSSSDCSGTAFLESPGNTPHYGSVFPAAPAEPGVLLGIPPVYYLPQSSTPTAAMAVQGSRWSFEGAVLSCVLDQGGPAIPAYLLLPNDPVETGIPDAQYDGPLRVITSDLFRDGFELDPRNSYLG